MSCWDVIDKQQSEQAAPLQSSTCERKPTSTLSVCNVLRALFSTSTRTCMCQRYLVSCVAMPDQPMHLRHRSCEVGSDGLGIYQALRTAVDTRMPSFCTPH